jgi:hypothetical protein
MNKMILSKDMKEMIVAYCKTFTCGGEIFWQKFTGTKKNNIKIDLRETGGWKWLKIASSGAEPLRSQCELLG